MSFNDDLHRFNELVRERAIQRMRRVALKAATEIIRGTPVDTGVACGNWRVGLGAFSREYDPSLKDRDGKETIRKASAIIATATPGVDIYITNSVPYIVQLEHGYSPQQPGGWVHNTVNKIRLEIAAGRL